jgi:hypothetical protein
MTWRAPTLETALASQSAPLAARVMEEATSGATPSGSTNPNARCACGRMTTACMLVAVRDVPAAIKARIALPDAEYLCDGCRERLFREGHVTREDFFAHLGAPPEALARIRAYRLRHGF